MDPQTEQYLLIGAIAVGVATIVLLVRFAVGVRERRRLREQFGPEYDRTVEARGSKRRAVRDLREREALHSTLELQELNEADRDLVRRHMASLQYRFVEDPAAVMLSTGRLMTEVLRARGYPVAENRERALRLFSVDYPAAAGSVRTALTGEFHGDLNKMRITFLGIRDTLETMAQITYVVGDASATSPDVRLDRGAAPDAAAPEATASDPESSRA